MISTFKNLTGKKIAGLLLIIIIIIAFGFGGFGGGFNLGNQNNIAKINNTKISTKDFMDYLSRSGLSQQVIKENIDKNILEELLSTLVSTRLLDLEIKDLNLKMSEKTIIEKLKKNKDLIDQNGNFQRTLYEKFLLTNNMSAPVYEIKLKNNILQKQLFTYISGGTKSPDFLIKEYYKEKNKILDINYVDLNKFYKKKNEFSNQEIKIFVDENSEKLKQDYIDFSYVLFTPKNLTGLEEFNQAFFDKIDDIENKVAKSVNFETIINDLNIIPIKKKNYVNDGSKDSIESKIYDSRNKKIEILDHNGKYIFYKIDKVNTKMPDINDIKFNTQIRNLLFQKEKYEFNTAILEKINNKEFNQISFDEFGSKNIKKIRIDSIEDTSKFEVNSIKILYSLPVNRFTLITDDQENIFVAKILSYKIQNISNTSDKFKAVSNEASAQNRNSVLKSYDLLLSNRYKVIINEKTLDRVKNYFRWY